MTSITYGQSLIAFKSVARMGISILAGHSGHLDIIYIQTVSGGISRLNTVTSLGNGSRSYYDLLTDTAWVNVVSQNLGQEIYEFYEEHGRH